MLKRFEKKVRVISNQRPFRTAAMLLGLMPIILSGRSVQAQDYQLGPDDVVAVTVLKHPEFSADAVTVTSDGKIRLPVVGTIQASGKTTAQLDREITAKFRNRLKYPEVTVAVKQARPQRVFVLGSVDKAGVYEFKPGWRVSEALAAAGGLAGRPELIEATLSRAHQAAISLNLPKILADGNSPANMKLQVGDTLRFTERTVQVSVAGEVQKPGVYSVPIGNGVVEAVAIAGGANPKAALTKVTVNRPSGKSIPVDLYKAQVLGLAEHNLKLEEGDLVVVPKATGVVSVQGAVLKPGSIDIEDGRTLRVAEALALAGGPAARAALSKSIVIHKDGTSVPVNLHRVLNLNDQKDNIELAPDDVVTVPDTQTRVTVLGAVEKPGVIEIEDGRTLRVAEAVAEAGNPSAKASLTKAIVKRADGTEVAVNLHKIITQGQTEGNIELKADDVVIIPESMRVTLLGAVARPGTYNFEEGMMPRISDVLAQAGGLSVPPAQVPQVRISVQRQGDNGQLETLSIDPVVLLESRDPGQSSQNVPVQNGDIITVSVNKLQTVFVAGEIQKQDAYELTEGDSVVDLIVRAGGPTNDAALRRVTIQRRAGQSQTVDIFDAIKKGGKKPNVVLQEGDYVVVPKNTNRVTVLGAVQKSGDYPIPEDEPMTVGKALTLAGGPAGGASLNKVGIARQTPNGVKTEVLELNKMRGKELGTSRILQPGDLVFVPERKQQTSILGTMLQVLTGIRIFVP
ncbi:MAG: SLBB domain-containing protein [Armatimonadota bacterium]|nr:SLBB domain-containing protein [Armatimonadota bacterium]